jgi:hypothetical protein
MLDALASEAAIAALVYRIERYGHLLPAAMVEKFHRLITDALPDNRTEGTQKDLAAFINERIARDDYNEERGAH